MSVGALGPVVDPGLSEMWGSPGHPVNTPRQTKAPVGEFVPFRGSLWRPMPT